MIVEIQGRRFIVHEREEWLQGRPFVSVTPIADQSLVQTAMCHYPGAGDNWRPPADTAAWIRFSDGLYRSDPNRGYPYGYGWQIGGNRVDWDADPIELDLWEVRGWDRRNAANNGDFAPFNTTLAPWNARTVSCQIACSQGFWDENPEVREDQILTFRYWVAWCDKIYDEHVNVLGHRQSDFTDCPGPVWPFLLQLAERPDPPLPPKPPPPDLEDEMPWRVAKKLDDSTWFMGDGTTAYTVGDAGQDISSTEAHIRMATGAVNVARQIFPESNTEGAGPKIVTDFAQVKRAMQRKYIRQYVGQHPSIEPGVNS